jgi:hypothetical protein
VDDTGISHFLMICFLCSQQPTINQSYIQLMNVFAVDLSVVLLAYKIDIVALAFMVTA